MTNHEKNNAVDINLNSPIDKYLPRILQPYARLARLDRPIGTWLLLLPCWWGMGLGLLNDNGWYQINLKFILYMALFAVGALVMRGAGCCWNDITDKDIDAKVARTRTRPIAAGDISIKQALVFLAIQCLIGLIILLQFNFLTIIIGIAAVILVVIYPYMKRVTYWPQAWLGLTFNWGILVGFTAISQMISFNMLFLYLSGICWTLGYDTIYAHQDKEDDALIGVKSTALRFGDKTKFWLVGFYSATIFFIGLAGANMGAGLIFWLILPLAALHLVWQIKKLDIAAPQNCLRLFKSNRNFGILVFIAIIAAGININ